MAVSFTRTVTQWANRELQKRNRQAHHDWAKVHQQELQQLRVIVTQSTETILASPSFQNRCQQSITGVETVNPVCKSQASSTNEFERSHKKFRASPKSILKLKARFVTPKWLFGASRAIEIYESRATAGWNVNIQVYNVVSPQSPIFGLIGKGCIAGIQQLFSTGQASPFDRDSSGWTLLDVRFRRCYYFGHNGSNT
jgi:hypothetical protein